MQANELLKLLLIAYPEDAIDALFGDDPAEARRLHSQYVHDADALERAIASESWDLVLARTRVNGTTLSGAVERVQSTNPDLPVIAMSDAPSRADVVEALRAGARDLVDPSERDHLRLVVERELANLRERRARRLLDLQHREFQRQTFALLNSLHDAIVIVRAGVLLHANPPAIRLCGYATLDDLRGRELLDLVAVRDRARVRSFLNNLTAGSKVQRIDAALLSRDGLPFDVSVSFTRTAFGGQNSHLAILRAATGRADAQQAMYAMSRWDQLTGLHTQRHFLAGLANELASTRHGGPPGTLLLVELENFRAMRQTVGIVATDLLVKDLASLVGREARDADAIGRFGNHTFAVLLARQTPERAADRAEDIRRAIEGHTSEIAGQSVATTCTVALVPVEAGGPDAEALMRAAEALCQEAIRDGGNRVVRAEGVAAAPGAPAGASPALDGLAETIREQRLRVTYRPIVHLHGGQEESYEVAVAAHAADGSDVDADALYAAAHPGESAELDKWLLDHAIATAHAHQRAGRDVHYFVRLSGEAAIDESVLVHLTRVLRVHGVHRHRLTFQIPESTAARQVRSARAFANAAKKLYCSTALDGFGDAVASVHAVEQIGVDYVKLGAAHTQGLARDARRVDALRMLQTSLRRIGKTTVATGVADAGTLMLVWQCGIDYAQGDYIAGAGDDMAYDFSHSFEYE